MWELRGLPAHVLLVHAVVVLVPATAAAVAAAAWRPAWRRRLGLLPPVLALASLVSTIATVRAGEWFARQLPSAPLIEAHERLGRQMLPWVVALLVASVAVHLLGARRSSSQPADEPALHPALGSAAVRVLVAVLATLVAVGATVQTVRTGESGSRAVWQGTLRS